jgi:hypothetical protein
LLIIILKVVLHVCLPYVRIFLDEPPVLNPCTVSYVSVLSKVDFNTFHSSPCSSRIMQSGLANNFRLAATKSNLFNTRHPLLANRNIAISASHHDTGVTLLQKNGESSRRDVAKSYGYKVLWNTLANQDAKSYRVWGSYFDFCSQYGPQELPPEIHSAVLRRCVPPTKVVRELALQNLQKGVQTTTPHMWEYRFQTVMGWLDLSGGTPTLEDYHFILEQFAVSGHFHGSKAVLQELKRYNITPTYKTYGLCLQCAAHRLKLPCNDAVRGGLVTESSKLCLEILEGMSKDNVPCTSVNLDLCIRILKESVDVPAFEKFLQIGYGIDLSFPDQPPLKILQTNPDQDQSEFPNYLPFSTSALNTTIDILGRRKLISRMVSAFEVLTKPLDSYYGASSRDFDDDDDWPVYTQDNKSKPPSAKPNTTSYNYLIKNIANANKFALARHYIIEAFDLDEQEENRLKDELKSKPPHLVESPRITVNRGTLLPIFGFANRSKHLPLTDWVVRLCAEAITRKEEAISYFSELCDNDEGQGSLDPRITQEETTSSEGPIVCMDPLDLELDSSVLNQYRRPPFDIELHLSILETDLQDLRELSEVAKEAKERISLRIKERIRRRIWNGKDIYLVSLDQRVVLPRHSWKWISVPPPETQSTPIRRPQGLQTRASHREVNPYFTPSFGRTPGSN